MASVLLLLSLCAPGLHSAPQPAKPNKGNTSDFELGDSNATCPVLQCTLSLHKLEPNTEECFAGIRGVHQCIELASVCGCSQELLLDTMEFLASFSCGCKHGEAEECLNKMETLFEAIMYTPEGATLSPAKRKDLFDAAEKCFAELQMTGPSKAGCEDQFLFPGGEFTVLTGRAWSNGCDKVNTVLVTCDAPLEYGCGPSFVGSQVHFCECHLEYSFCAEVVIPVDQSKEFLWKAHGFKLKSPGVESTDEFLACLSSSLSDPACEPLRAGSSTIRTQLVKNQRTLCGHQVATQRKVNQKCEDEDKVVFP